MSGRYPAFVFGGSVGSFLPVFHFHEVTRAELEPKLRHLADNGYRTVVSDEIAAYVRGDLQLPARTVGLCFDDAWKSLATVAAPLLQQYGLRAITYAIPARITEYGEGGSPFVTWSDLSALHASGSIDVQSHTDSHSRIFASAEVEDFIQPGYETTPLLNRPQLSAPPSLAFATPADLGAPLEFESVDDQARAIEEELARSRSILNERLKTHSVAHICLPWGISSTLTEAALKRTGYRSAFANRLRGQHAVHAGDDAYWLKRLPNHYITRLPGRGRRYWFS